MSFCYNSNSPIDLNKAVTQDCDNKCLYEFNYIKSSLNGINKKTHLEFTLQNNDKSDVKFYGNYYNLEKFMLFRDSAHSLNGTKKQAEIVIEHSQINNPSKKLVVCILINVVNQNDSDLDFIIEKMSLLAPRLNDSSPIKFPSFSLNNIIPQDKYYNYRANLFYLYNNSGLCEKKQDIIVFDKFLTINTKNYNNLIDLINKNTFITQIDDAPDTFYSKNNAVLGTGIMGENDIYIECKPTGEGEQKVTQETIDIKKDDRFLFIVKLFNRVFGFLKLRGAEIFGSIIGAIIIYVILKLIKRGNSE